MGGLKTSVECPFCETGSRVTLTREIKDGAVIIRRRECEAGHRFRTEEHSEWTSIQVQKRGDWVEPFNEEKLRHSLEAIAPKTTFDPKELNQMFDRIRVRLITETPLSDENDETCVEHVVDSELIYEFLLDELKELDERAYLLGVCHLPEDLAKERLRELGTKHVADIVLHQLDDSA